MLRNDQEVKNDLRSVLQGTSQHQTPEGLPCRPGLQVEARAVGSCAPVGVGAVLRLQLAAVCARVTKAGLAVDPVRQVPRVTRAGTHTDGHLGAKQAAGSLSAKRT